MKRVIDLTAGDGMFAYACLKHRTGYVGICFTQEHAALLEEMLIEKLKVDMAVVGDPLYNPQYALAVGKNNTEEPPQKKQKTEKATAKKKPKKDDTEDKTGKKKEKKTEKNEKKTEKKKESQKKPDDEESELFSVSGEDSGEEEIWDPLK